MLHTQEDFLRAWHGVLGGLLLKEHATVEFEFVHTKAHPDRPSFLLALELNITMQRKPGEEDFPKAVHICILHDGWIGTSFTLAPGELTKWVWAGKIDEQMARNIVYHTLEYRHFSGRVPPRKHRFPGAEWRPTAEQIQSHNAAWGYSSRHITAKQRGRSIAHEEARLMRLRQPRQAVALPPMQLAA
jgi:hypothetical protein